MVSLESRIIPPGIIIPSLGKKKPFDLPHYQGEEGRANNRSVLAKESGADVLYRGKYTFGGRMAPSPNLQ